MDSFLTLYARLVTKNPFQLLLVLHIFSCICICVSNTLFWGMLSPKTYLSCFWLNVQHFQLCKSPLTCWSICFCVECICLSLFNDTTSSEESSCIDWTLRVQFQKQSTEGALLVSPRMLQGFSIRDFF